jgi:hypothetical protein
MLKTYVHMGSNLKFSPEASEMKLKRSVLPKAITVYCPTLSSGASFRTAHFGVHLCRTALIGRKQHWVTFRSGSTAR